MSGRVLFVYYSFTEQTQRAAEAMADEFISAGWEATTCRLQLAEPLDFPLRPLWARLLSLGGASATASRRPLSYDRAMLAADYDLVCIGSPTWGWSPAFPISSFLTSDDARRALQGRRFAVFVVCRGFWRRNLRLTTRLASKAGGRFLSGRGFGFGSSYLKTNLAVMSYYSTGEDQDRFLGLKPCTYGLSDDVMAEVRSFARSLAASKPAAQSPAEPADGASRR